MLDFLDAQTNESCQSPNGSHFSHRGSTLISPRSTQKLRLPPKYCSVFTLKHRKDSVQCGGENENLAFHIWKRIGARKLNGDKCSGDFFFRERASAGQSKQTCLEEQSYATEEQSVSLCGVAAAQRARKSPLGFGPC